MKKISPFTMIEKFCNSDSSILPGRDFYLQAKETGKLIAPEIAADFVVWVMCSTSNTEFHEKPWNIGDTCHHQYWLSNGNLYANRNENSAHTFFPQCGN